MLEPPARKGTLLQARNLGVWETGHFQQFPNLVLSVFVVLVVCVSLDPLCQPPLSPETQQGTTDSLSCVFDGLGCCIAPGNTPGKLGDTACSSPTEDRVGLSFQVLAEDAEVLVGFM